MTAGSSMSDSRREFVLTASDLLTNAGVEHDTACRS